MHKILSHAHSRMATPLDRDLRGSDSLCPYAGSLHYGNEGCLGTRKGSTVKRSRMWPPTPPSNRSILSPSTSSS